jgi:hypothetical protein
LKGAAMEYVEYCGNVYEVYERKEKTTVLMDGYGFLVEMPSDYFETLRPLKEEDISR